MNTNQNKEIIKSYAINELYMTYRNSRVRERVAEEVEIEVPLHIKKSRGALWLLVVLPANYPNQVPIFQIINAKVEHEYIDDSFIVRHPILEEWDSNSSLTKAVVKVNEDFDNDPPQLKKGVNPSMPNKKDAQKKLKFKKPELKDFEDKIKDMSDEEVQTLLEDEAFFNEFFLSLDGVEEFVKTFGEIMKQYYKKAEENIKTKEDMDEYLGK